MYIVPWVVVGQEVILRIACTVINPRHACAGGLLYLSCVCVCEFVCVCYNSNVNIARFYSPSKEANMLMSISLL